MNYDDLPHGLYTPEREVKHPKRTAAALKSFPARQARARTKSLWQRQLRGVKGGRPKKG